VKHLSTQLTAAMEDFESDKESKALSEAAKMVADC
jgi:hypothetical protein